MKSSLKYGYTDVSPPDVSERAQLQKISSKDWKIPFAELKTWREGEGQRSNGRLIRQLNHRNVNPLIGACVELNQVRVISMYAHKGSLYDVIHSSSIKLDATFLVSFAMDICKGMTYVHTSPVCYHGNLKSSNVLVDRSWTCKLPINLPFVPVPEAFCWGIQEKFCHSRPPCSCVVGQFWTAPEVLREERLDDVGWQKADVYSYGIILYELLSRKHPYDNYWDDEPQGRCQRSSRPWRSDAAVLGRAAIAESPTLSTCCAISSRMESKIFDQSVVWDPMTRTGQRWNRMNQPDTDRLLERNWNQTRHGAGLLDNWNQNHDTDRLRVCCC
ncbi:hypothetical protein C0Q70_04409 [Pomacea canaliculata]|uniref:guanylate cyclase n=1 Tax=Pomacea canaliculata TaxID=400727 RepID=A0A2T7PVI7_POMCA|nr:hypothetical protein C0Q70_04409 [Pomacea canaliculata]